MAQREDFVTGTSDLDAGSGRNSSEIRSEIDRTRSDMDETFAALDAKLTPKEIGLELWNLFKGGSSTGASKLWQVAREHPMPAAVVGLGLGWLLVESSGKSDKKDAYDGRYRGEYRGADSGAYGYGRTSYRQGYAGTSAYSTSGYEAGYESDEEGSGLLSAAGDKVKDLAGSAREAFSSAGDKVGDAAGWTKEHVSELGHEVADRASSMGHGVAHRASALRGQAKQKARSAKLGFWQTMEENPLMVGAAVLALGVIAGLAVPSTDKEDELMGETRDRLLDDVKEAGQQALDKGKHVAEAVVDKVKEEAHNQGLTAENVVDKVKTVAREATNTVKEEAQRQNLTPDAMLNANKPDQPQGQQAQGQPQGQGQQPAQNANDPAKAEVREPELAKR
jgi:hypothetical protein